VASTYLRVAVGGVEAMHVSLALRDLPSLSSADHNHLEIFFASAGEFAPHFQPFCAFFCVLHMMFEAFGMSGRVDSPGC
jgi:hypothetical protein